MPKGPSATRTETLQQKDNYMVHLWEFMPSVGRNRRTVAERAGSIYMTDSDGNRLIDGPAGMWCVNIGHGRQEMAQAIADQVMQLDYVSPWGLATEPAVRLAEKLAALAPGDLNNVFFTTGGSTAVDSALRFVTFFNNLLERPQKKHIIARAKGYHGSTHLAASCSGKQALMLDYDIGSRIDAHCQELGLLVRPLIAMCVMSPPLIITKPEIDTLVAILREGIERAMEDMRREGLWQG